MLAPTPRGVDCRGRLAMERVLAGLSARRYPVGLEPVGERVQAHTRATSKSTVRPGCVGLANARRSQLIDRVEHPARCFIHLANAEQWQAITGEPMPTRPITPGDYARHGIPWFDYAAPGPKAPGSDTLAGLKTVAEAEQDAVRALPDDGPIPIDRIRRLPTRRGNSVREDPDLG